MIPSRSLFRESNIDRRLPIMYSKLRALIFASILLSAAFTTAEPCFAQFAGYSYGATYPPNDARQSSYNAGIGGYASNNSFNSGLSSFSSTANSRGYSTQRSTQAAQNLARSVSRAWTNTGIARAASNPQQGMAQAQQWSSQPAPTMNGLLPQMSKHQMLRVFLEGGTPQAMENRAPTPNAGNSNATSVAYSNYQTAENESRKAYNSAQRVRYSDKDTWSRKNDASHAEYAANNADYAAQRAESAAYNGDSQARGYANLARQAANRARSNANQARYNADTMR